MKGMKIQWDEKVESKSIDSSFEFCCNRKQINYVEAGGSVRSREVIGVRALNGERLCRETMRRGNNLNFGFFPQ